MYLRPVFLGRSQRSAVLLENMCEPAPRESLA